MKACYYCPHSFEDDEGIWCGVDWDALEYEPKEKQDRIREACAKAKETKKEKERIVITQKKHCGKLTTRIFPHQMHIPRYYCEVCKKSFAENDTALEEVVQ